MKQGQKANATGNEAENIISGVLARKGYKVRRQVQLCRSIYGTPLKVDFVVRGVPGFEKGLIVESKWQSAQGSVDEKYPYLVENIRHRYPYPTIVVLGGGAQKPGAEMWLRAQIGGRLYDVMTLTEFITWVNNLVDSEPLPAQLRLAQAH